MERKSDTYDTTNRIYDEFEPISNWKSEQGFETLTVYLPGFRKEQLKVQITTTTKLRVMGDRPAGANKWIRFAKVFPIPLNIDLDSVSAKFEGTNLVVKLPRPEPIAKPSLPSGIAAKPPPVPKENLKLPSPVVRQTEKVQQLKPKIEKQTEKAQLLKEEGKEEAERAKIEPLKVGEKAKNCVGILNQDSRSKVNAYKENLGGYVALMKNNRTLITAGLVVPDCGSIAISWVLCWSNVYFLLSSLEISQKANKMY